MESSVTTELLIVTWFEPAAQCLLFVHIHAVAEVLVHQLHKLVMIYTLT